MCIKHPYQIKWRKSKKLLDAYIDRYNADKPLKEQLRANHKALAQYLLFIYSTSIAYEQAYGGGVAKMSPLPLLRTNNVQLAKAMGCSVRTIINLRARLKAAKVILKEVFHGSNAQYEVELSGAVIHIQAVGEPDNIIHLFQKNAAASLPTTQTLRHTVPSNTDQVTKELIELSGVDSQQQTDFQVNKSRKAVENGVNQCAEVENVVENQHSGSIRATQDTRTGYETSSEKSGTPPGLRETPQGSEVVMGEEVKRVGAPELKKYAPGSLLEALEGLSDEISASIRRHVQVIWTCALLNLYDDKWIAEEEAERAKAVLAEYFIYSRPERFQAGAAEIIERIILVRRWIERGEKIGEKRWVPLPARYFDFRNSKGFTRTKPWFKAHIQAKAEIKAKELVTKAIKQYLRAQEPGAKISPAETYRRISQRLGKYESDLLNRFHEQIANVNANSTTEKATA